MKQRKPEPLGQQLLPWLAGAGFALGQIAVSSRCTVAQQGHCSSCGGCLVAVTSIVAWAVLRQRRGDDGFTGNDQDL